jgi:DNA modification methylase
MILTGDVLEQLKTLTDESVQCCITSPPYWGLRDYGNAGQIGLEKTPEEYVAKMVEVFREVRRVLRKDGTLWLNLGDSYANTKVGNTETNKNPRAVTPNFRKVRPPNLKHKDLVGIPCRVAFALQTDGWYLRQDIIWSKPNPMPESVTDRCTKSHEYMFLLTKSTKYYFDAAAIAEPITDSSAIRLLQNINAQKGSDRVPGKTNGTMKAVGGKLFDPSMAGGGTSHVGHSGYRKADGTLMVKPTRNKRSVWTITTKPFKGAHFAVMPEALVEPCIKAGTKVGDMTLDPFAGSGTVGVVAKKLRREFIGIELNPEYVKMAKERIKNVPNSLL